MASIDERVVKMSFDNKQFESGASQSMGTLAKLKGGLDLSNIADSVSSMASKFSALGIMGVTALMNISNAAVNAGIALVKSITTAPISQGFSEYETKLGSIQTILANTSRYGTNLETVNKSLNDLNTYADKTIYNFGDMTKNIGLFTNAGIRVEDATSMIKGFSNAAAASGTTAQGASGAAYQLSQALSTGTIRLMDWRSLTNVGMGNKNMQDSIIDIAQAMGTFSDHGTSATDVQKDFNGSLEKGWLTADVMQNYLKIMAGEMDDTAMASLGLNEAQIASMKTQAATAEEAATKVRTWTQLIGTLQEAVGSGWSQTFEILFGNFNEATDLFTNINNVLSPLIDKTSDFRNNLLQGWKDLGGRGALLEALSNVFKGLISVITPIGQAFREIFPPTTAQQLYNITLAITEFSKKLVLSETAASQVKRTFAGVFAIFDILFTAIKAVAGGFATLVGKISPTAGSFLATTASIGDFLVKLDAAIKNGKIFEKAVDAIVKVLTIVGGALKSVIGVLADFGGTLATGAIAGIMSFANAVGAKIGDIKGFLETLWAVFKIVFEAISKALDAAATAISAGLTKIGNAIQKVVGGKLSFSDFTGMISTGLLAAIGLAIKKVLGNIQGLFEGGTSLVGQIGSVFDALTNALKNMQQGVQASSILKIAVAVALLAASLVALAGIDTASLAKATGAITALFGELLGANAVLGKMDTKGTISSMTSTGISLILLAAAINVLVLAVKKLSEIDTAGLTKGLIGVGVLLTELSLFLRMTDVSGMGMLKGAGILLLALAVKTMASAVGDFASLNAAEIGKGLAAIALVLTELALFTNLTSNVSKTISTAVSLVILAAAMKMFAGVIQEMGGMSWETIGKGLVTMAGALLIVAGAMYLMPSNMLITSVSLIAVAAAITILAGALKSMGGMSWEEIAKGLITLAGSLIIIAGAMYLMTGALPGAAALLIVAASMAVLAPVLLSFGNMSWGEIAKGLTMLAGVFLVLGLAGLALTPVVPTLLLLGVAVLLLGVGCLAAGVGIAALAVGLTALSVAGAAGTAALTAMFMAILALIPYALQQLGLGIVALAGVITQGAPAIVGALMAILMALISALVTAIPAILSAMVQVLLALISAVVQVTPAIVSCLVQLVMTMVSALVGLIPWLVDAGMQMVIGILSGISANIGRITELAIEIMVNFLNAIADRIPSIAQAGGNIIVAFIQAIGAQAGRVAEAGMTTIITFINSLTASVNAHAGELRSAGLNLAIAIVDGMTGGLASKVGEVVSAAANLGSKAIAAAKNALDSKSPSKKFIQIGKDTATGLAIGIRENADLATAESSKMGKSLISSISGFITDISDVIGDGLDLQPTITPVLDMSEMKSMADEVNSIFTDAGLVSGDIYAKALAATPVPVANTENTPVVKSVEVTLQQTNTSPKALSRTEIYRDTKSALNQLKEELNKP